MRPFLKKQTVKTGKSKFPSIKQYLALTATLLFVPLVGYDLFLHYRSKRLSIIQNPSFLAKRYSDLKLIVNYPPSLSDFSRYLREILNLDKNKNRIPRVDLNINYKNLVNLECQRREKIKKNNCLNFKFIYSKGNLIYNSNLFKVKLRTKGDRNLHFIQPNDFSMKVDIRGDSRLWGMEEFSIQDPIIRNYTYEAFASRALREEGIITPRHFYAKLFVNGVDKGVKHFEETIASELIESNKRRYGPTFSLNEESTEPMNFEIQDKKFWSKSNPELAKRGLQLLDDFYTNPKQLRDNIDIDKWAKYFAFIDVFNLYHGSVRKSVKYHLNPVYGKIEPVFFDGHHGVGRFDDFLLIDRLITENNKCGWICKEKNENKFFEVFFGTKQEPNKEFLVSYLNYLKFFSSEKYIDQFILNIDEYSFVRKELYRNLVPSDNIFHKSFVPHILSVNRIKERAAKVNKRIVLNHDQIRNKLNLNSDLFFEENSEKIQVYFSGTYYINSNTDFDNKDISFKGDTEFIISPNVTLSFKNSKIKSSSGVNISFSGSNNSMVVLEGVSGEINSIFTNKLGVNSNGLKILYGGINFINSNLKINQLIAINSSSEDAVNFIDSKVVLGTIKFEDIKSDALDSDFSELSIDKLLCSGIKNDCLDISFSNVRVNNLEAINIGDKAVSAGEKSKLKLVDLVVNDSEMAIVSKDLSKVEVENFSIKNVKVPIALFIKKPEFGSPDLTISKSIPNQWITQSLVSKDSSLKIDEQMIFGSYSSSEVLNKLYGNEFGVKTKR